MEEDLRQFYHKIGDYNTLLPHARLFSDFGDQHRLHNRSQGIKFHDLFGGLHALKVMYWYTSGFQI